MSGTKSRLLFLFVVLVLLSLHFFRAVTAQVTNNLSVSATVPATATDFPVTLVQNTTGTRFPQDTELAYTITYGSTLNANADLTLVASWSRGTVDGDSSPSVDIIDYVPGSASNAYNSTPPVIDTVNRTITWAITALPGPDTTRQVTFHLKTNHSYTGASFVTFNISAQAHAVGADSAVSSLTKEYQYDISLVPTATPTSTLTPTPTEAGGRGPTATPGPRPSATSTPTQTPLPSPQPFQFTTISLETVSPTTATIAIGTSQSSTVELSYGLTLTSMTDKVTDLSLLKLRLLRLDGLKENTRYYFRITAINEAQKAISSDIYTFKTGGRGAVPIIDRGRTIITSKHILLYPSTDGTFVIPKSTDYELNLVFADPSVLKKVVLSVPNKLVLGAYTGDNPSLSMNGEMKEIERGKYVARLSSPSVISTYALNIRVSDRLGNISDVPLGKLKVVNSLTVFDKAINLPVEHARVKLYYLNYRTAKYEVISPQVLALTNPLYTGADGTVEVVLPQGRYRADVLTLLNKPASREFILGPGENQEFPYIYVEREAFSIIPFVRYQWETCQYFFASFLDAAAGFSRSLRLFEFNAYLLLSLFIVLTIVSFRKRIKIPFRSFVAHFRHRLQGSYFPSVSQKKITGVVRVGAQDAVLTGADVFLINPKHNAVLAHTTSRETGIFSFAVYDTHRYVLEVMKDGYQPTRFHEDSMEATDEGYVLTMQKERGYKNPLWALVNSLLSFGMETLIIVSFLLEILFVYVFGIGKTAPFIAVSLINLFFIILHNIRREDV